MIDWLRRNRTSARVAFGLRLFVMGANGLCSFFWTNLILRAMGDRLNGLFIAYQAVVTLGGLGDLGMGGAVGLRAGQALGRRDDAGLRSFLANARSVFLILSLGTFVVLFVLAPWLPTWLHFEPTPGAGSFTTLFMVGAVSAALVIFNSYWQNLNYACGTVVWPILPGFILVQLALCSHWILAKSGSPLWVQITPYLGTAVILFLLIKAMVNWAHPSLGNVLPLHFRWNEWRFLLSSSAWAYLCSLGNVIYTSTDQLVIKAGFASENLPRYRYNYRLCELALQLVLTASVVSMPKITQWMASALASERERAAREIHRLNQFQVVLGCAAALVYLAINDIFVRIWLGEHYVAPLGWGIAFALNLAITTGGDSSVQVAGRCGANGIRTAGIAIGCTGVFNLILSIISMKLGSITGIAVSTVIAQSILSLILGAYICNQLKLARLQWFSKSWGIPVFIIGIGALLKYFLPPSSIPAFALLAGCYVCLLFAVAWLAGVKLEMIRSEIAALRSAARR